MSRELFAIRPDDSAERVLRYLLLLGLTGAPVIDDEGKPIGMFSLRDHLTRAGETVLHRMSTPALAIWAKASLADAAELLGDTGAHRVVVVNEKGVAVGVLSALDLTRSFVGKPTPHPRTRASFDDSTGLVWTGDEPLHTDRVQSAPAAPGLFVLTEGGAPSRILWVEAASNLQSRLMDLAMRRGGDSEALARILEGEKDLRFRAALEPDARSRDRALGNLLRVSG